MISKRMLKSGKFVEFVGETKEHDTSYGLMASDGLIYLFDSRDETIKKILSNYPSDKHGWFFNSSRDPDGEEWTEWLFPDGSTSTGSAETDVL